MEEILVNITEILTITSIFISDILDIIKLYIKANR